MTLDVEAVPASVRPETATDGAPPAAIDRIEHVVTEACARLSVFRRTRSSRRPDAASSPASPTPRSNSRWSWRPAASWRSTPTTPTWPRACCWTSSAARPSRSSADPPTPRASPRWPTATRPTWPPTSAAASTSGSSTPRWPGSTWTAWARRCAPSATSSSLPGHPDPLRPLLAQRRGPLRAAAAFVHARGDGPGAQRGRPRGARDRVLRAALLVRLHGLHAHPVQRGHGPRPAVVVLSSPPSATTCRTSSTASATTRCCPSTRAASATTGPRSAASDRTSGGPTARARRRPVPEDRQRHTAVAVNQGESGRARLRLPGDLAHRHRGVPRPPQEHR